MDNPLAPAWAEIGPLAFLVAGLGALIAVLSWASFQRRWVPVEAAWQVPMAPEELRRPFARLLHSRRDVRVRMVTESAWTLTASRAPGWALALSLLLLVPTGGLSLLFLLFRTHADLDVVLVPAPGGSEVQVIGTAPGPVVDTLRSALAPSSVPAA